MWKPYNSLKHKEKYLFKFLSKKHLVDFIGNNDIWFSRADQFGDKMECVHISDLLLDKPNYSEIEKRKRKYLISCWHHADRETLAFWDTHSKNSEERRIVALRFKKDILIQLFRDWFYMNNSFYIKSEFIHGRVRYGDLINPHKDVLINYRIKHPAFRKEGAFGYESEYRFVIKLVMEHSDLGYKYNLRHLSIKDFDILINPLLSKIEYLNIKQELIDLGVEESIKPSALFKWLNPEEW
jgi:hypothetical protein